MGQDDGSLHISEDLGKMEKKKTPVGVTRPSGFCVMTRHYVFVFVKHVLAMSAVGL